MIEAAFTVPHLLTVAEAGRVLGCSGRTVRRRIADGELAGVIEHGRLMVRGDDLATYVEGLERIGAKATSRRRRIRL
jgi:excisionase family DNA binding protein